MTLEQNIGKLVPGMMSLAVVGESLKLVPNDVGFRRNGKRKTPLKSSKKLVKGFVDITLGTSLIGPTSDMIAKL